MAALFWAAVYAFTEVFAESKVLAICRVILLLGFRRVISRTAHLLGENPELRKSGRTALRVREQLLRLVSDDGVELPLTECALADGHRGTHCIC